MAYDFLLLCLPFQNIHWSKERKRLWDFCFFFIVCYYIPNKMAKEVSFLHNNSMSNSDQGISYIKMQVCVCVCACARRHVHEITQSCPTLCNPMDCSTPISSVHGILKARILQWVAIHSFRGSFLLRDRTSISSVFCIDRCVLYH